VPIQKFGWGTNEFPIQSRQGGMLKLKDNSAGQRNWTAFKLPARARGMDAPSQIKELRGGVHLVRRIPPKAGQIDPRGICPPCGIPHRGSAKRNSTGQAFHGAGAEIAESRFSGTGWKLVNLGASPQLEYWNNGMLE